MEDLRIRPATAGDLDAINAIYNHYVTRSTCTYQTELETADARAKWFAEHGPEHPVIVAVEKGEVVAWASLSPVHSRCAYRHTVEDSIYVRHDARGRGIGSRLLLTLIERARYLGHHTIVAHISADQDASVALHRKHGFAEMGRLREVGLKFDRWLDVVYMQLML